MISQTVRFKYSTMMCSKTVLALLLLAVTVNAQYVSHPPPSADQVCLPMCPGNNTHVYLVKDFNFKQIQGVWWLTYSNEFPPGSTKNCVHWTTFNWDYPPTNSINVCWAAKGTESNTWEGISCGDANGGGFWDYSKPEISNSIIRWRSTSFAASREYYVIDYRRDEIMIITRCEQVKGKYYRYVHVLTRDQYPSSDIEKETNDILKYNNMNPRDVGLEKMKFDSCTFINTHWD